MSWHVRPALVTDLDALHALAQTTGPGFTNIPHEYDGMAARLAWSLDSFDKAADVPGNDLYLLVLANDAGELGGTAMLFADVGSEWPFYSYKISRSAQYSRALKRTVTAELLNLVTDNGGASEVGGLFLRADLRKSGGLGPLLARSRYLFVAAHRARFGDTFISELRGWLQPDGQSPFWDAIGRQFFGMDFVEANQFNVVNGNQFIADLMPKHPIYTVMLPEAARRVMGVPHDTGVPAMRLLTREGFRYEGYLDIFDGGPTMRVPTDLIATLRASHEGPVVGTAEGAPALAASGRLFDFRCRIVAAERAGEGWRVPAAAGLAPNEEIRCVAL